MSFKLKYQKQYEKMLKHRRMPLCFDHLTGARTNTPVSLEKLEAWRANAIAKARGSKRKWLRELEKRVGDKAFQNDVMKDTTNLGPQCIGQLVRAGFVEKIAGGGTRDYPPGVSFALWRPWAWYKIIPPEERNADLVEFIEDKYETLKELITERHDELVAALGQVADQQKNERRKIAIKLLCSGKTMAEVAELFGLTRERIRQWKIDAMYMVKKQTRLSL